MQTLLAQAEGIDPSGPSNEFDRGNDQIPLKRRNTLKMSEGEIVVYSQGQAQFNCMVIVWSGHDGEGG